jgi:hypothetical protein
MSDYSKQRNPLNILALSMMIIFLGIIVTVIVLGVLQGNLSTQPVGLAILLLGLAVVLYFFARILRIFIRLRKPIEGVDRDRKSPTAFGRSNVSKVSWN